MSFEKLPKDLQTIINEYVKDLKLVELYDKFYLKYKDKFNLVRDLKTGSSLVLFIFFAITSTSPIVSSLIENL